jgi:prepilin-type N-terminal cleavage/methylation domain-containing protein
MQKGFTLIEVLIVLGFAAILGSMACLASYDSYKHALASDVRANVRASLLCARAFSMANMAGMAEQGSAPAVFTTGSGTTTAQSMRTEAQSAPIQIYGNGALGD